MATSDYPAAVLFDMDGTLVDTEPYWMAAEAELVAEFGGTWTAQDAHSVIGFELTTCAKILQDHGVRLSVEEIVSTLIERVRLGMVEHLPWQPGAQELLRDVAAAGIPLALVTMSYRAMTEVLLAACPPGLFTTVVSGEDVSRGKPHPEPYLTAAERLGVEITDCIAIEDSSTGVKSAAASGARTIAVPNITAVHASSSVTVIQSLTQLTADRLSEFARSGVLVTSRQAAVLKR